MNLYKMMVLIEEHAIMIGYTIGLKKENTDLEFFLNYVHGVAFYAKINGEHIQIYQYHGRVDESDDLYGKHSIYSIRNTSDLIDLYTILSCSARIRAGRHEE